MKTKATVYSILAGYSNIIFSIVSGLILVPFYLKDFGAEVYGVWLATGNLIAWLGIMGGALSIVFAQKVAVAYAQEDTHEFRKLVGSGLLLFSFLACIIFFGAMLASDPFLRLFSFDRSNLDTIKSALIYSSMAAAISVFHSLFIYILGAWLINSPVLLASLIGGVTGIIINIVLLYFGFGLLSIPLAMLGKSVVILILLFKSVYTRWIKLELHPIIVNMKQAKLLAFRSGPILISNLASIGLNHSQSTIIGLLFGPTAATIISVTDKLYSLTKTFVYPIGNALLQPLSSIVHLPAKFDEVAQKYIQHMDFLVLFCILFCMVFNERFIYIWLGQDYYGGDLVSVALAFSAFLIIRVNIFISILNARGLFRITSWYTIVDLSLRILALLSLYYVIKMEKIEVLPIAECIGILIGTRFVLLKQIKMHKGTGTIVFYSFIGLILVGILGQQLSGYQFYFELFSKLITGSLLVYFTYKVIKEKIFFELISQVKTIRTLYSRN